jgi:hypothetical protein
MTRQIATWTAAVLLAVGALSTQLAHSAPADHAGLSAHVVEYDAIACPPVVRCNDSSWGG